MTATEKHYSVHEIAQMWGLSAEKVRRMFQDVPGVLKLGVSGHKKRPYVTLRIPASVLDRFHEDRSGVLRTEVQRRRRVI